MSDVVTLDGVGLRYRLPRLRRISVKEYALLWASRGLQYQDLWALRDVTLAIAPGETVGIVGRNGAGKSTLLRLIAGVLRPTLGTRTVRAAVTPILDLTSGLDRELTGVENAYLSALLLGRERAEISALMPSIVEFSGLGDFAQAPVRTYSSGMAARLAFSVLTAWTPEVLLLDEVLAVGDAEFVERCEERLRGFRRAGTTVLLVSHSLQALRVNCARCARLDGGRIVDDGPTADVLARYEAATARSVDERAGRA